MQHKACQYKIKV